MGYPNLLPVSPTRLLRLVLGRLLGRLLLGNLARLLGLEAFLLLCLLALLQLALAERLAVLAAGCEGPCVSDVMPNCLGAD